MNTPTPIGATENLRARLRDAKGPQFWRSLEELADTQEFRQFLQEEFPYPPGPWQAALGRRDFLRLMGASLALAGLAGCKRQPPEKIVPYVRAPENLVPGKPQYFATALTHGDFAQGVVVKSHMGRPIKVEGNDLHPASLGASDIFAQAAILSLYDPDRSHAVTNGGQISSWDAFLTELAAQRIRLTVAQGAGLRILTRNATSPTLADQLQTLLQRYPQAGWHRYDPVDRHTVYAGAQLAFGVPVETLYRFDAAKAIVSLDSDFLASQPGHVRYARDFAAGRRVRRAAAVMSRLYAVEATPTVTGAAADHRWAVPAGRVEAVARALARGLGLDVPPTEGPLPVPLEWLERVSADLAHHAGTSIVIAGDQQGPVVHALAQAMNGRLGNFGKTVVHADAVADAGDPWQSIAQLAQDMAAGQVNTLLVLGGNPVYDAPADVGFAEALERVPLRIHWGLHADETAERCHWHIPALHELESWSDTRGHDGTASIVQPLIAPLSGGYSVHEVLALLLDGLGHSDRDIVRAYWRSGHHGADFEAFWNRALQDGLVPDSAAPLRPVTLRKDFAQSLPAPVTLADNGLELQFRPDPTIWDGSHANNGWLQELPKPLSKLTWDNPALVSPRTAEQFGLASGDVVELDYRGRRVAAPVWIMPGQADGSVTLCLGYGRRRAGRVGSGAGFDAYRLRTATAPWFGEGLSLRKAEPASGPFGLFPAPQRQDLATSQHHHSMAGHDLVRVLNRQAFQAAASKRADVAAAPSMYPPYRYEGYSWGMAIDLNACIGCSACVVACQAENNIPIVGKQEVLKGREMHWLRIDRYYAGGLDAPQVLFQPVPCMQCEDAPCEPVCPVHASVHDSEGINNQVYNRCVGTRTCQSNCPYKVRRFNFFDYAQNPATNEGASSMAALRNPEVTVRSRGVMEKCSYCVQRISAARIEAEKENRTLRDGEVVTACQAACPTQAIVFGDINDAASRVSRLKAEPHHYALLGELGTRPRTTYLAKVRNPNPEIDDD